MLNTSIHHYKSRRPGQVALEQRIKEICQTRVRYGYRRVHELLRREGWHLGQNKTRRIYRELGLQLRNKTPKRRVKAKLCDDRRVASRPNETWGMDFVHDQLATGRKLRVLTIQRGLTLDFSRPGKPTDNAFIEAFNSRFRDECLNAHWFMSLADARKKFED
jgi:putative transposase